MTWTTTSAGSASGSTGRWPRPGIWIATRWTEIILNQITIPCADYAASVAFYKALGLVQIVDSPPRYARFESASGDGATLSLHAAEGSDGSGVVIYFDHHSAEALDEHVRALEREGLRLDSQPQDQRWGWREARLKDPAGNEVCLMFAGGNRRFPAWRIASASSGT